MIDDFDSFGDRICLTESFVNSISSRSESFIV
jgi:hypothetical protein